MKQFGNSFVGGFLQESKGTRNKLSLDLNTIDSSSTVSSKHFHTKSFKESSKITFNTISTGSNTPRSVFPQSSDLNTETNLVPNSTYNIRRKINSILEELSPRSNANKPFYMNTQPENSEFSKKAYSLFQTDIDEMRKGKEETTTKSKIQGEKNKLKREINYFTISNKLTSEPKTTKHFNRPMINVDKPILKMKADDFVLHSPTSARRGSMVNSTFFRNHFNQNVSSHKQNIFGDFLLTSQPVKQPSSARLGKNIK